MRNISVILTSIVFLVGSTLLWGQHGDVSKKTNIKSSIEKIIVSKNGRFLQHQNGEPFFWLADTGWLLFEKLTRDEAKHYLENRREKRFNVIQCMVIPSLPSVNAYGNSAFIENDISQPLETPGKKFGNKNEYDFWDHIDYIIDEAAKNGIYIAMVPIWGSVAKQPQITVEKTTLYTHWLAERFRSKPNIFWINGGDIRGSDRPEIWSAIGTTIKKTDPDHLLTYHPFGRTQSSTWFHNAPWLDFNMFQSGHRRYDQNTNNDPNWKGEDNWRYVLEDYAKNPTKPTLDGEPSYEAIPQGLHDFSQPYWKAEDCRRYAYWSVFAGSCGHTYGNNAVMQMHKPETDNNKVSEENYGVKNFWFEAINDSGANQMKFVKQLILSRPYFERVYDSTLVVDQGSRYDFIPVTRGKNYLFAYTYTGRPFTLKMGAISGSEILCRWYNPRNGKTISIGRLKNTGVHKFIPPVEKRNGNDWVLVLDDLSKKFSAPGFLMQKKHNVVL